MIYINHNIICTIIYICFTIYVLSAGENYTEHILCRYVYRSLVLDKHMPIFVRISRLWVEMDGFMCTQGGREHQGANNPHNY